MFPLAISHQNRQKDLFHRAFTEIPKDGQMNKVACIQAKAHSVQRDALQLAFLWSKLLIIPSGRDFLCLNTIFSSGYMQTGN